MDKSDPSGAEYWRRKALGLPDPPEYKAFLTTPEDVVNKALEFLKEKFNDPKKSSKRHR